MSITEPTPELLSAREPFGYAFEGVTLELARGRLQVDGNDTAAGPLILKLLSVLCRSPGLLVLRQQLFEAIWPRQTVSDEALTKLIARLRETLGPYGRCVVTLRGRGVRLDATVTELAYSSDVVQVAAPMALADETIHTASIAATPTSAGFLTRQRGILALALVLAVLLAWLALHLHWRAAPDSDMPVLPGYGITLADLHTARPETQQMLREANAALDRGEIERAATLIQVAHESDPATVVPGALLAYLRSRRQLPADPALSHDLTARLGTAPTPYVRLLVRLADDVFERAENGAPVMAAMVAMRPFAWRFQLGLAHQSLALRREPAALAALRQIPQEGIPADVIVTALADRASLGEAEAVARLVEAGALASAPQEHRATLLARLAWTDDKAADAIAHLDEAARFAAQGGNVRAEIDAHLLAALIALHAGWPDAQPRLEQTASLIRRTTTLVIRLPEIDALIAQCLLDRGEHKAAQAKLREAATYRMSEHGRVSLEVFNARLGLILPAGSFLTQADRQTLETFGDASAVLLADAWIAQAQGDSEHSLRTLDHARAAGVDQGYLREDAAMLDARLRGTTSACRPDPPYPNLLRFSTCRALAAPR